MQIEELFDDIRKIVELYKQGKSANKVSKETPYSQFFISEVIKRLELTRSRGWYWKGDKNPRWNRPNLQMSAPLAYILGVLYGDGDFTKKQNRTRLTVTSKIFIESFRNAINGIGLEPHKIHEYEAECSIPSYNGHKITHYFSTGFKSKAFGEWYQQLTLQKIEELLDTPELMNSFIRGFYESDGSLKDYQISFGNTNKQLLELVQRLLIKLGYQGTNLIPTNAGSKRPRRKKMYELYFCRKKQMHRFIKEVKPVIRNIIRVSRTYGKHLTRNEREKLINDIQLGKLSNTDLQKKYNVSFTTINYHKKGKEGKEVL